MDKSITWVIETERTAYRVYEKASYFFSKDREFSNFLKCLSRDERLHYELLSGIAATLKSQKNFSLPVNIDNATMETVDNYFRLVEEKIDSGTLTKENMIQCIISTEFSEYNDIFLYVFNSIKSSSHDSVKIAAKIQQHKKYIERFFKKWQSMRGHFEAIKQLPDTYDEKILIVEEETMMAGLLEAILKDEGTVEIVVNAAEGLRKLMENHYSIIITEADMPDMSGIDFYRKVIEKNQHMHNRFLFLTMPGHEQSESFFKENHIKYFIKPTLISDIKKEVVNILSS